MDNDISTTENVNIDKELLAILCCPETKQDVRLSTCAELEALNEKIAGGNVKNTSGVVVTEKLYGSLLRADREILYPIREDIPIMPEPGNNRSVDD